MILELPQGYIDQADGRELSSPSTGASSLCGTLPMIGQGRTAKVRQIGAIAVKVVNLGSYHEAFDREWKILRLLRNVPNVVNLAEGPSGFFTEIDDESNFGLIYMELWYSNLRELINSRKVNRLEGDDLFTRVEVNRLMYQILCAVDGMHTLCVISNDIKPENILVSKDGRLALADFGEAIQKDECTEEVALTEGYQSPETMETARPARSSDIWSVGVILGELLTGEVFTAYNSLEELKGQAKDERLREAVCGLLAIDINLRWTAKQGKDAFAGQIDY